MSNKKKWWIATALILVATVFSFWFIFIHVSSKHVETAKAIATPEHLKYQSEKIIGAPRIKKLNDSLYVALSYDLANTILIRTDKGNVIVDASASPSRAKEVKAALQKEVPGPTLAIIYTHSHLDHIGGTEVWVEEKTQIWATNEFRDHLIKQYGLFRPIEARRAWRQFGRHVPDKQLSASALGKRLDLIGALDSGVRMPTNTFSGKQILTFGDVEIHLIEAHGETHDQLLVWIPQWRALLPGDNYYHAFPNLYTIRGTRPRPVDEWIDSLDKMRRYRPQILIPSHTQPIVGEEAILQALTNYRDGIQWLRDEVVRRANKGEDLDTMVEEIGLPPHLVKVEALRELYGQIDWSVKSIYGNELGWFDGRADHLYPINRKEATNKEIALMGGAEKLLEFAAKARKKGEIKWAIHLLAKLRDAKIESIAPQVKVELISAYRALAEKTFNTNGRAYLLEVAYELENGLETIPKAIIDDELLEEIPLRVFFRIMCTRLIPEKSIDAFESVAFVFEDTKEKFFLTVRKGIAELGEDSPLPGTPESIVTVTTDAMTWKRIAVKKEKPLAAISGGRLKIDNKTAFLRFMKRFNRDG